MAASPTTEIASGSTTPTFVPQGKHSGKPSMPIGRAFTMVGSRHRAHLHLLSSTVSKSHAAIVNDAGNLYIRDTASREHVFVNGQQVREGDLRHGDQVKIGSFAFRFVDMTGKSGRVVPDRAPEAALEIDGEALPMLFEGRTLLIGRRPTCDIVLKDVAVSNVHAIIFELNQQHYIRDLGSRTGTFVNGEQIHNQPLNFNDVIRVGDSEMRFVPTGVPSNLDELEHLIGTSKLGAESQALASIDAARYTAVPAASAPPAQTYSAAPGPQRLTAAPQPIPVESNADLDKLDLDADLDVSGSDATKAIPLDLPGDTSRTPTISSQVTDAPDDLDLDESLISLAPDEPLAVHEPVSASPHEPASNQPLPSDDFGLDFAAFDTEPLASEVAPVESPEPVAEEPAPVELAPSEPQPGDDFALDFDTFETEPSAPEIASAESLEPIAEELAPVELAANESHPSADFALDFDTFDSEGPAHEGAPAESPGEVLPHAEPAPTDDLADTLTAAEIGSVTAYEAAAATHGAHGDFAHTAEDHAARVEDHESHVPEVTARDLGFIIDDDDSLHAGPESLPNDLGLVAENHTAHDPAEDFFLHENGHSHDTATSAQAKSQLTTDDHAAAPAKDTSEEDFFLHENGNGHETAAAVPIEDELALTADDHITHGAAPDLASDVAPVDHELALTSNDDIFSSPDHESQTTHDLLAVADDLPAPIPAFADAEAASLLHLPLGAPVPPAFGAGNSPVLVADEAAVSATGDIPAIPPSHAETAATSAAAEIIPPTEPSPESAQHLASQLDQPHAGVGETVKVDELSDSSFGQAVHDFTGSALGSLVEHEHAATLPDGMTGDPVVDDAMAFLAHESVAGNDDFGLDFGDAHDEAAVASHLNDFAHVETGEPVSTEHALTASESLAPVEESIGEAGSGLDFLGLAPQDSPEAAWPEHSITAATSLDTAPQEPTELAPPEETGEIAPEALLADDENVIEGTKALANDAVPEVDQFTDSLETLPSPELHEETTPAEASPADESAGDIFDWDLEDLSALEPHATSDAEASPDAADLAEAEEPAVAEFLASDSHELQPMSDEQAEVIIHEPQDSANFEIGAEDESLQGFDELSPTTLPDEVSVSPAEEELALTASADLDVSREERAELFETASPLEEIEVAALSTEPIVQPPPVAAKSPAPPPAPTLTVEKPPIVSPVTLTAEEALAGHTQPAPAPIRQSNPALSHLPPVMDPMFGMTRDFGSFLGGVPLSLAPSAPMAPPARPAPRPMFGDTPVSLAMKQEAPAPAMRMAPPPRVAETPAPLMPPPLIRPPAVAPVAPPVITPPPAPVPMTGVPISPIRGGLGSSTMVAPTVVVKAPEAPAPAPTPVTPTPVDEFHAPVAELPSTEHSPEPWDEELPELADLAPDLFEDEIAAPAEPEELETFLEEPSAHDHAIDETPEPAPAAEPDLDELVEFEHVETEASIFDDPFASEQTATVESESLAGHIEPPAAPLVPVAPVVRAAPVPPVPPAPLIRPAAAPPVVRAEPPLARKLVAPAPPTPLPTAAGRPASLSKAPVDPSIKSGGGKPKAPTSSRIDPPAAQSAPVIPPSSAMPPARAPLGSRKPPGSLSGMGTGAPVLPSYDVFSQQPVDPSAAINIPPVSRPAGFVPPGATTSRRPPTAGLRPPPARKPGDALPPARTTTSPAPAPVKPNARKPVIAEEMEEFAEQAPLPSEELLQQEPVELPPEEAPEPQKKKKKWKFPFLKIVLLGFTAAGAGAAWFGLSPKFDQRAVLKFDGLDGLDNSKRNEFARNQARSLDTPEFRKTAQAIYEDDFHGLPGDGFLSGRTDADATAYLAIVDKVRAQGGELVLQRHGVQIAEGDSDRLRAMLKALYRADLATAQDAGSKFTARAAQKVQLDQLSHRMDEVKLRVTEDQRRKAESELAQNKAKDLTEKLAMLDKASSDSVDAIARLKAQVKSLSETAANPPKPVEEEALVRRLESKLADASAVLAAAQPGPGGTPPNPAQTLDVSLHQFQQGLDDVGAVQASAKLQPYLGVARKIESDIIQTNADRVERQRIAEQNLADLKRSLAEKTAALMDSTWSKDPLMIQIQQDLAVERHRLGAAVGAGLTADAGKIRARIELLNQSIQERRDEITNNATPTAEIKSLRTAVADQTQQMRVMTAQHDAHIAEQFKLLDEAAPSPASVSPDQQPLVDILKTKLAAVNAARQMLAMSSTNGVPDLKALTAQVTDAQVQLDAARKQLADAAERTKAAAVSALATGQADLDSAQQAAAKVTADAVKVKEDLAANQAAVAALPSATADLDRDNAEGTTLADQIDKLKLDLAHQPELAVLTPHDPEADDLVQVTPAPSYRMPTVSACGVLFVALLVWTIAGAFRRVQSPADANLPAANGDFHHFPRHPMAA